MDKTDIELFLTIAQSNSISKAAESMHFTQSTVSYRLKTLEKELNVPLFYRRKGARSSELTTHGELFVPIAEQWLRVYQDTQELKFYPDNLITVGAVYSISDSILSDVYAAVSTGDNPLRLKIITGYSLEIYNLVDRQEADIGFIADPEVRKNVITTELFRQKYYVARYARHPSAMRLITPESLDPKFEIYIYWGGDYDAWHQSLWGESQSFHAWVDSAELLQTFLTDERYWAIVPGSLLQNLHAKSGQIQIDELLLEQPYTRKCYMIKPRYPKVAREKNVRRFEAALRENLHDIPDLEILKTN